METISNELWVQLPDGRLMSMNRHVAQNMVFAGEAVLIPPERVERTGPNSVVLLPQPKRVEAATVAAPERAVSTKPGARTPG